jgi:hypothetical protein
MFSTLIMVLPIFAGGISPDRLWCGESRAGAVQQTTTGFAGILLASHERSRVNLEIDEKHPRRRRYRYRPDWKAGSTLSRLHQPRRSLVMEPIKGEQDV